MLFIIKSCISAAKAGFSGRKIIALFLLLTTVIFSQDWNNTVQTTIPYSGFTGYSGKVDLFTNKDGNHILVQNGYPLNNLKYYLVNTGGTVLDSTTIESQAVEFAGIDGNNEKVYIVYKIGSYIKTKKSTDAGQSWSPLLDIGIGNNTCNNVDIIFGEDALHVVWATQDNGNDYETYYYKLSSDDSWVNYKNVTDYSYEVGGFPTVSVSPDRVHVSYNTSQVYDPSTGTGNAKSRDKYDETWQTPQLVYEPQSFRERIHAGSSKLFDFYYKLEGDMSPYSSDLYVKTRDFGSTSWSSATLLQIYIDVFDIVSATNTTDGQTHIVYSDHDYVLYRNYSGGIWSSEFTVGSHWVSPKISSVSNDLFVVWGQDNWSSDYVQYRQYDAVPLTPQNFSATTYDNHPKITWSACNEPDVYSGGSIKVYRGYEDGLGYISWLLAATLSGNSTSWVDNNVTLGNKKKIKFYYKISSVDVGTNESPTTTPVMFYGTGPIWKNSEDNNRSNITTFSLSQNYPNPFNPATKIKYSIKEDGLVTIKVYDILGVEIATLVNENKAAGEYEVEFKAGKLPSGMYIYKLQAVNYTDVKKMILAK